METEIWKDVPNYEGIYQVSNLGRIKSMSRKYWLNPKYFRTTKEKYLNGHYQFGYKRVTLSNMYKNKKYFVHRLVAQCFIPNPKNKPQINHINGNKMDNCVNNLEWATSKENINHSIINKLSTFKKGKYHHCYGKKGHASKTVLQMNSNNELINEFSSSIGASLKMGYKNNNVSSFCLGVRKCPKGFIWKYK